MLIDEKDSTDFNYTMYAISNYPPCSKMSLSKLKEEHLHMLY